MLGAIKSETSDCDKQSNIVSSTDCSEFGVKNVTSLPDSGGLTSTLKLIEEKYYLSASRCFNEPNKRTVQDTESADQI